MTDNSLSLSRRLFFCSHNSAGTPVSSGGFLGAVGLIYWYYDDDYNTIYYFMLSFCCGAVMELMRILLLVARSLISVSTALRLSRSLSLSLIRALCAVRDPFGASTLPATGIGARGHTHARTQCPQSADCSARAPSLAPERGERETPELALPCLRRRRRCGGWGFGFEITPTSVPPRARAHSYVVR